MSCQENDKLIENAHEIFCIECLDNYDFYCLIHENFFSAEDQWIDKEFGRNGDAVERAFECLVHWDFEETVVNPIEAAKKYAQIKELHEKH